MKGIMTPSDEPSGATDCVRHPEAPLDGFRSFSVPVYRASTVLFEDAASYRTRAERNPDGYAYGLNGTPTSRTLEAQITRLHGGVRSIVVPSGQAAITALMMTVLRSGDEVLIADNVYPPVKSFCRDVLSGFGITTGIYDPMDLPALERQLTGRVRLIWIEAPGSTTMEVADVARIAALARSRGVLTGCDNSWASPLLFKPLAQGVDVVAEAITKYIGGHSDVLLGSITFADFGLYTRTRKLLSTVGIGVSPDDCSLALRGLETLAVRLAHVQRVAYDFAQRLGSFDCVAAVLHPALPNSPGHAYWAQAFEGSSGVFSLLLKPCQDAVVDQALSKIRLFGIGPSWGGTRSLIAPMGAQRDCRPAGARKDAYLRLSIGLEDEGQLWTDLAECLGAIWID